MAILHVRGVPDDLYSRIQAKAQGERRSISGEVILLLERAMEAPQSEQDNATAEFVRRKDALQLQAAEWYRHRHQPMSDEEQAAVFDTIVRRAEARAEHYGPFPDSVAILRADRERDDRRC